MTSPLTRLQQPQRTKSSRVPSFQLGGGDSSPEEYPCRPYALSTTPSMTSINSSASGVTSSFQGNDCSEDGSSLSSEESEDAVPKQTEDHQPIFSSMPTRRLIPKTQSAHALARGNTNTSPLATNTVPLTRRTPSFPVSRPIRPFDSITNAMGTAPTTRNIPPIETNTQKPELKIQTRRSNVLLEPPKNNRFQHGFFILDMTQDEFKTRAW